MRERALTSTLLSALITEPAPRYAWTVTSRTPMSIPPATPTKPPAAPPAIVRLSAQSTAETLTDCEPSAARSLTSVFSAMNALTTTPRIVTPTPPATPTKPPPTAGASPKTSSLEVAWTARPWKLPAPRVPKPPAPMTPL